MTDDSLTELLPAIEIAAFARGADGSFTPVAPAPAWFARLGADGTFPFLGHILEEAEQFWAEGASGRRDWGPCAEVGDDGVEFHYTVTAVIVPVQKYLVFQLDPGSDRIREVLQKVRDKSLAGGDSDGLATLAMVQGEVRRGGNDIHDLLRRVLGTAPTDAQSALWATLSARCDAMMDVVDELVKSVRRS